ncbi:uncharacterized protein LOC142337254 [Convolutriloba macropyga]|uniref:uncharacterized protein LOC142337254 n=1 Tax=Convolutriloba macropyga TaxID=536237 RepID=UPI003F51C586
MSSRSAQTTAFVLFVSAAVLLNVLLSSHSAAAIRIQTHKFKKGLSEPFLMPVGEYYDQQGAAPVQNTKRYLTPRERADLYALEDSQFGEKRSPTTNDETDFFFGI